MFQHRYSRYLIPFEVLRQQISLSSVKSLSTTAAEVEWQYRERDILIRKSTSLRHIICIYEGDIRFSCSVWVAVLIRFPVDLLLSFATDYSGNSQHHHQQHHNMATSRSSLVDQIRISGDTETLEIKLSSDCTSYTRFVQLSSVRLSVLWYHTSIIGQCFFFEFL